MPSSRTTKDHTAWLDKTLQDEISRSLAQALKDNPGLSPQEALLSIQRKLLENNPYTPLKDGSCPINKLPPKVLAYIFQTGVDIQRQEWDESEDHESEWEDVGDEEEDREEEEEDGQDGADDMSESPDSDINDDCDMFPLQVLVSHVCRRWRSLALDTPALWSALAFRKQLRLDKTKAYISRSATHPLRVVIDCHFAYQDEPEADGQEVSEAGIQKPWLSLDDLSEILDVLVPEIPRLKEFIFRGSTYEYIQRLMWKLHKLPAAQLLESFQIYLNRDQDDYEDSTSDGNLKYLPFQGQAPNLKEATFYGAHIDWDRAAPDFLRGLRRLNLAYLSTDNGLSFATFSQIIKASPELAELSLSQAGPSWPALHLNSDEARSRELLVIPALRELVLNYRDPAYASALMQRIHVPNLTRLSLSVNDCSDCSEFVRVLAKPVEGSKESVLQHISQLIIIGLPCDIPSMEVFLSELSSLESLGLPMLGMEEETILKSLIEPSSSRCDTASGVLPGLFCPQLEEMTVGGCDVGRLKKFITSRREAGVPLKKLVLSEDDSISKADEQWILQNVQELQFTA